jgi:hypothetical protein
MSDVFYMNEAVFELPEMGFVDHTVTAIDAKTANGADIGIRVHRSALPGEKTLREIVDAHVAEATRSLPAYSLLWKRDATIADAGAIELGARWRGDDYMNYSRQAHFAVQGLWLLISVNTTLEEIDAADLAIDRVLSTLRFAR